MTLEPDFRELLEPHVQGATLDRLVRYAELLERWAERHNLVRYVDRRELVERHLLDALAALPLSLARGRLLDIGSGAGLPGVPLLAASPGWEGLLLEPRQKRWAFLRLVIRELDLKAQAERVRYQELRLDQRWHLITVRAVGGHGELLRWARAVLAVDGEVLVWTTKDALSSLSSSPSWRVLSSPLSSLDRGLLVRLQPCFT
jgi:16S rRNA (guanine527-N7)-methyltransferase